MISFGASEQVELHLSCQDLKGVQIFGLSDLYVKVKQEKQGSWNDIGRTEVIGLEPNPKFTHTISLDFVFETKQSIRFEVWDDSKASDGLIGTVETTLGSIMGARKQTKVLELKGKDGTTNTGKLTVIGQRVEKTKTQTPEQDKPTFIDYLKSGEQLHLITAIDFTASNGDPKDSYSLHAIQRNKMNEYQAALFEIGQILLNYDYDQMVPIYGFGGVPRFPQSSRSWDVSHCFSCTGDPNGQVFGMKGIMDAYAYALMNVELAGPTFFNPIIQETLKTCREHKKNDADVYKILLILTDGEIHDMDPTIDSIVSAADLPLSIIIIGIGDTDWSNMEILDGDEGLVNSKGETAKRDLVQFVPFRKYQHDVNLLAQHVLAEIPDQLVKYKQLIGKKPKIVH